MDWVYYEAETYSVREARLANAIAEELPNI